MDNCPSARRPATGHAFHAEQAREALGIVPLPHIGAVPISGFHVVAGIALALAAWAMRRQTMGLPASVVLDIALGAITLAVLVYHERTVTGPAGIRGGIEPGVLPVAAFLALCLVLDGDADRLAGVVAVVLAAATIALVPHLDAERRAGRAGPITLLGRQLLGVVVLAPMLVAAATASLPAVGRLAIVAGGVTAVGLDAQHVEGIAGWRAVAPAGFAAGLVAVVVMLPGSAPPEARAGALLIVWYGARSLAATVVSGRFGRVSVLEYTIFAGVAGMALEWTAAR